MAAYSLSDTNLFVYCRNNPIVYSDDDGYFINTVIGAFVGGVVAAVTIDSADPNYVEKVALAALSGAISGFAIDAAIASAGIALPLVIAAAGGGAANAVSYIGTQCLDKKKINASELACNFTIGAVMNMFSYSVSIPQIRYTSGGSLGTRILLNSDSIIKEGALKTVVKKGVIQTVQRKSYNTIIATNKAMVVATTAVMGFGNWILPLATTSMIKGRKK
jgi:hypothetical protein